MKHFSKMLNLLFSVALIIASALIIPAFAEDPPPTGDGDGGTIIGEVEMTDVETVLGENGESQTSYTDLQTYVPAHVNLDIGVNGSVKHNKTVYSKNAGFNTMTLIFYIMPKKGYKIDSVYWNGKDVTKLVSNGLLKIKDLEDGTLKVRFKLGAPDKPEKKDNKESEEKNAEPSGDETTPQKKIYHVKTSDDTKKKALFYISIVVLCLVAIGLTFIKKKKMRYLRKK